MALSSKKSSRIVELIPLGLLVSEAIATLSSFSLVERTHSAASFSIHPLIHTWTRERCTIDERRSFALKATQGLGVALGKLELNTFSSWAQRRQILPHVQVLNEWAKELFFKDLFELSTEDADHFYLIGCEFMRDEQYASAFPWLSKALECQESKHGKDHSTTLTTVHQLGSLFFYQENIAQASIYYERAYLGRKTLYGTEHSLTLVSLEGLALVYSKKGDEGKCLELHEEVLAARHRALGNLHEDTLYSWFLVGLSLARLERPEEALEMVMRAFVGFQKTFGQDHPKTLQTARYVGWVFLFMRNCEESLRYYRLALAGQEHHLGKDHSETLSCAFGVGMVHQYQSEFGVALNYYVRVLVGREALFGEDFHSVMEVVEKIAEVQRQSSQYDDAVNSYLRLLRSRQAILGVDHLDSLNVVEKVADTYMDANRFDDALEWYQRLATAFQRLKGSLDVKTLTSQRLKESLDLKTLTIKSDMAYYLFRLENYTEAITAYQEVLEVYAMLPQAKQAYFYGVTLDLAEIYYNDRQYPKALDYSQRAFDFYAEHLTEDYPIVLAFFYLGRSAAKTMKWKTAISKCIDILEKLGPPKENNLKPKQVLSAIALVLQAIGKVLLLSKNEETAAKCYVLVMKYWMASGNRGGHAAICDGCEMRGGDLESIEGTRYICRTCEDTDLCQRCMLEYDRRAFDVPSCRNHPFFAVAPLSAAAQDIGTTIEEQIALFTNELNGMQQELLALESNECKPREA